MPGDDRSEPLDGRCNARTASGYCHSHPVKGATRCYIHGGASTLFSARLKRLSASAQEEVDAALRDPELLDVRRPLAIAEALIANTPLIPSDETLRRLAQRRVVRDIGPDLIRFLRMTIADTPGDSDIREILNQALDDLLTPTDADIEAAALEAHEHSMKMLAMYSKRQVEAVKQLEWARAMREVALPFLGELAVKIAQILRKHVPEAQYEAALAETRRAINLTLGELSEAADNAKRR